jgi:hypothetical protein
MAAARRPALLAVALVALAILVPAGPAAAEEFVIGVLGDSYGAGEGAPATPGFHNDHGGTGINLITAVGRQCIDPDDVLRNRCFDETWWNNIVGVTEPQRDDAGWDTETLRCHRSSIATGPRAARRLEDVIETDFPSVEVVLYDLACSGAELKHLTTTEYKGIEPSLQDDTPLLPPQIGELQRDLDGRRVDAIIVSIGGNDSQFAPWVAACMLLPGDCVNHSIINPIFRSVVPPSTAAPSPQNAVSSDSAGTIDERFEHLARRLRSPQTPTGAPRGATEQSLAQVPGEVYLTPYPQALQDENGAVCNGTQTGDQFYREIKGGEGAFLRDTVLADISASHARAATRHGWQLVSEITAAGNTHGLCSNALFFQNNLGGLRTQGHDLFPNETNFINFWLPSALQVPRLSAAIAHPNAAGYTDYGQRVASRLDDQVAFRFGAPAIQLQSATASPPGFEVRLVDNSAIDTGFWQLEVNGQLLDSDDAGPEFTAGDPIQRWRRSGAGEFTVRGRECFKARNYCGPFSSVLTVANTVPGAPQNLHRDLPNPFTLRDRSIRVDWDPGVNTPASARYEVAYRKTFAGSCPAGTTFCQAQDLGPIFFTTETTASTGTSRFFRLGSVDNPLGSGDSFSFRVRACTDAGCSPYSPLITLPVEEPTLLKSSVVGIPTLRLPPGGLRAGERSTLELTWTAPGRWTDLRTVDVVLSSRPTGRRRARARRVGTIRFLEAARELVVRGARGRARAGAPDSDVSRTLRVRGFAVDLRGSGLLRYGPDARNVTLRLTIVPRRSLRGRTLTIAAGGRNDRGRRQAPAPIGALRVR